MLATSPISEEEIDDLADFLDSVDSAMNIEKLDGFFSALVIGPQAVLPGEYWPFVMGPESTAAAAIPEACQLERAFSLAMKFWNTIAATLAAGDVYSPVFLTDAKGHMRGNEWAKGFMQGVGLRADRWAEVISNPDLSEAIVPMLALAQEDQTGDSRRFKLPAPQMRKDFLSTMALGMRRLYEHFLEQRSADAVNTRDPVIRSTPKVGRNDPCPCGSGKKFKQCCLGQMH